jgi:hypothetical protein
LHLPSSSECCAQCCTDTDADSAPHFITHTTFDDSVSHVFSHTFFVVRVSHCFPYPSDDAGTHPTANGDANGSTNRDAGANTCIDTTTDARTNADKPSDEQPDHAESDKFCDASTHDARQRLLLAGCSWLGCSLQLLDWHTVV